MNRTWHIWSIFAVCVAVFLGGMGWLSLTIMRLDTEAREEHAIAMAMRLMQPVVNSLITRESAVAVFEYQARYDPTGEGRRDRYVPSHLLLGKNQMIRLHFQIDMERNLTSPQVPVGDERRDIEDNAISYPWRIDPAAELLNELQQFADYHEWAASCEPNPAIRMSQARLANRKSWGTIDQGGADSDVSDFLPINVVKGAMKATWFENELFLMREVSINGTHYIQGCWIDWPELHKALLSEIKDLLPDATFEKTSGDTVGDNRVIDALAVRLIPFQASTQPSPLKLSIGLAMLIAVVAAFTVGMLLRGVMSLSERRAAFVSAVTHELRTPLTTFKLYTDMLASNKLPTEEKKQRYLNTLQAEADRLGHLVENVLAYARLDQGRARDPRIEAVPMSEVLDHARERLEQRTKLAGMNLVIEDEGRWKDLRAFADTSATEQVLFNLVDNACKYAASADDKHIYLSTVARNGVTEVRVRDQGPGVPDDVRSRLFQPFSKSEKEAANSAPGVGLGLSLCRRLARDMGGDLRLEPTRAGACFVLTLRRSDG